MKDYYYILGVPEHATSDIIKDAYKKLSKKFHPDMNDGDRFFEERFKEIQEAYEILSDNNTRREYDRRRNDKAAPFSSDTPPTNTPPNPSPQKTDEVSINRELPKLIIGAVIIIGIASLIYLATRSSHNSSLPTAIKPKDICNCNLKFDASNINISVNSSGETNTYIEFDYDTLKGKIDSIQVRDIKKSKRFDEDVEDVTDSFTNFYRYNCIVKSTYKDPYLTKQIYKTDTVINITNSGRIKRIHSYDRYDDEEYFFYDDLNRLIKKIHKSNGYDSITLKYEYQGCNNKLSCIKIYNSHGDNISVCNVSFNAANGSVDISTLIKDYRSSSIYNDITKEISTYEILFDSSCGFKEIRHVYYEYPSGSGHIRQSDNIFNNRGLLSEAKDLMMKGETTMLPPYYEGDDYSKYEYESNDSYDYQYDKNGNWVAKIRNDGNIIRRKIFYHQSSSKNK